MDTSSRVLQPLNNRPDACTERDVVSSLKASKKEGKHTAGGAAARFENRGGDGATADPSGRLGQGGRDQAGGQELAAGEAAKPQPVKGQPQSLDMSGQHDAHDAAEPSTSLLEQQQDAAAAAAASPASHSAGDTAADSSGEGADDDAIEDPDFDEAAATPTAAATRGRPRRTAARQQSSDGEEDAAAGSELSEEVSDDADADSPQERRPRGRPRREQQQVQQAGSDRARRAAAVAAVGRIRGAEAAAEQQEMAVRRSARTTARVAVTAAEESDEDVPVARPRRAAAAAAKEATAAALAAEAAPLAGASQPDSDLSDLGSPDASDAEADAAAARGANSSSDDDGMAGSDSEGGLSDEDDLGGSGSWGTGAKRQRSSRAQPARQQPRRGRGGRAVVVDDSDEPSSGAEGVEEEEEEGSPEAGAAGGDLPLNLDAFRFDGKAAGSKRGAGRRRGSSGDGSSREGSEEPVGAVALAASLQEEEELSRDVLPASEFAPLDAAKLGRGQDVDKCLAVRYEEDDSVTVLVKLLEKSYRHAVWLPAAAIEKKRPALLRNFLARQAGGEIDTDWADTNNINPAWYKIDRIVSEYNAPRSPTQYLVKWCGLEYSECTWETQEEICRDGAGQVALSRYKRWSTPPHMRATQSKRPRQELLDQKLLPAFKNGRNLRDYQEESLHWMVNNYRGQVVSGRWKPRNCILGDEMGLGKTAQSIAVISWLKQYAGASAPCCVVAPLTTLGHWKREIETWTDLNVVLYGGSALDRQIIREREFWYPKAKTYGPRFNVLLSSYETVLKDRTELKKLNFEALIVDEAHRLKNTKSSTRQALQDLSVRWLLMLSGTPVQNNMKELQGLMSLLDHDLYGDPDEFREQYGSDTPTLEQIRALQGALAPVLLRRMKEDVEDLPEKEEVVIWVELTAKQRRYYRALYSQQIGALLGGGSNKNLPSMRNLAMELRKLCCHPFLCDGLEDDMTLKWQAQDAAAAEGKTQKEREVEKYTRASGKMLLLHKLLPKLRAEGRQVLIFSQFKMMLDVIEDYLTACDFPFERIDGDTKQAARQAAIDRFMAVKDSRQRSKTPTSRAASPSPGAAEGSTEQGGGDAAAAAAAGTTLGQQSAGTSRAQSPAAGQADDVDGPFVFLLSTRAGGQGITLTSADTVIIYDSDWNPQNDLQAMARCHRIGQDKEVTVYRLVSKSTYEQQLFECSSRKMGLDEAILGFAGTGDNPENDAVRIEQLLRLGAHAIMQGGEEGGAGGGGGEAAGEEKGFAAEDIEQILLGRSEKRQLGSRKGNTFSIAHFGDGGGELEPEQEEAAPDAAAAAEVAAKDSKTFWAELLPEAAAEHAARAGRKEPEVLGPRRRRQVDYREANMGARPASSSDFTAGDGMEEDGEEGGSSRGTKRGAEEEGQQGASSKKAKRKGDEVVMDPKLGRVIEVWKTFHVETVRDALLRYGIDQVDKVVEQCRAVNRHLESRERDEVVQLCEALLVVLKELATIGPKLQHEEKAARAAAAAAAAAGDEAAAAAAAALARTHGNLSTQYVNNCREALVKAGLEDKLPPACSKAVLALQNVRAMGRSPAGMLEQMLDHSKVHQAMLKAGLVKARGTSSSASKPPTLTSSEEEQQQEEAVASTPAKSPAAAAAAGSAAAAAAGGGGGGVEAPKRVFVVPRVMLRGSKGLPTWWRREQDDMLLQGCYAHGYFTGSKLQGVAETILQDPAFGFTAKVGLDPEALVREAAEAEALKQPGTVVHVQVTGPDGQTRTQAQLQRPKAEVDAKALAAAQAEKQQLLARHAGIQLISGADMKNLVVALAQRLKRVRAALCDPNYVEPPTPSKQLHLHNPPAVPGRAAAPPAAAAAGPSVQQRLQMTAGSNGSFTFRGKPIIGGGLPAVPAAGGAAGTPPGQGLSPAAAIARQMLANQQQHAVAQQTAANMAAANAVLQAGLQARKRQAEQQLHSVGKRPNASNTPSPGGAQQQQQLFTPQEAAAFATGKMIGTALAAGQAMLAQQAALQRAQQHQAALQLQQQQRQQPEVVELLDDDDSSDIDAAASPPAPPPGAAAARTPAAAGANPPSSGLLVRRLPAGADLSQEQSVDEPPPGRDGAVADTAAGGGGKQHMQLLLGDPQQPGSSSPRKGRARAPAAAAAAEHPVYGTPAGAAAAAAAAGGGSTRRKANKEDPQQRKINAFFASSK